MSLMAAELRKVRDALRASGPQRRHAPLLGLQHADMTRAMQDAERLMAGALLRGDPAKSLLEAFAGDLERPPAEIARIVGRREAQKNSPKIADFLVPLRERIQAWRQL